MLAISRNDTERIFIGNDIVITLVKSRKGRSIIGIDAPKNIPIVRDDAVDKTHKPLKGQK